MTGHGGAVPGTATPVRWPVVELRQYTLHPGRRDELVALFDREFVETQEAAGMAVIGQFRDLDDPERFVWLRGFADMPGRAAALAAFYGGPVWQAHRDRANATMVDSDDVLLLRPVAGFPPPAARDGAAPSSLVVATICRGAAPFDAAFADAFERRVRPALAAAGAAPLAVLQTLYEVNTFPALPVRDGEHAFVWLTRFPGVEAHEAFVGSPAWRGAALPALAGWLRAAPRQLRLSPTPRSALR